MDLNRSNRRRLPRPEETGLARRSYWVTALALRLVKAPSSIRVRALGWHVLVLVTLFVAVR